MPIFSLDVNCQNAPVDCKKQVGRRVTDSIILRLFLRWRKPGGWLHQRALRLRLILASGVPLLLQRPVPLVQNGWFRLSSLHFFTPICGLNYSDFIPSPDTHPPPGVKNGFIKSCLGCRSVAESPRGVTRPLPAPPRFCLAPVDSARVLRFCPGFAPARCSCSVLFLLSCPDCAPAMPRNPDMLPRLPRFFRTGLRGNRVASGFLRTSTTLVLNRDFEAG